AGGAADASPGRAAQRRDTAPHGGGQLLPVGLPALLHPSLAITAVASSARPRVIGTAATLRRMSSEVSGKPAIPDPHTTAGKIAILQQRRDEAIHAGSARAVERQHAKGKMTARERIDRLLDPGSLTELDELRRARAAAF